MGSLFNFLAWLSIVLVVYVYIGYPALLWLLARFIHRPVRKGPGLQSVSLIIAAYNEEKVIEQKLLNSLELDYPQDLLQIIVVADGSSDQTQSIAERYENDRVLVLHTPERRGKCAAMNRAAEIATGDILVFSDANAFYYPNAIRELMANFADSEVGCVSGSKTVKAAASDLGKSEGAYWKYEAGIKKLESKLHSTIAVVGEMLALRRNLYTPIPEYIISDDAFLANCVLKLGKRVIYEPAAVSWETPVTRMSDEVVRRQRISAARYRLLLDRSNWYWRNPLVLFMQFSHKFLRLMLPLLMLSALVFSLVAVVFFSGDLWLSLALIGQLCVYALAFVGYYAEKFGRKLPIVGVIYYIVSGNWASILGLIRYMTGRQSVAWERVQRGD